MVQTIKNIFMKDYTLESVNVGKFAKLVIQGMNFKIEAYQVKELGMVAFIEASGLFGLAKKESVIISPLKKDMPLFFYNRTKAFGKDSLMIDLYDTMLGSCFLDKMKNLKEKFADVTDDKYAGYWFDEIRLLESIAKKGRGKQSKNLDALVEAYVYAYLNDAELANGCVVKDKKQKTSVYLDQFLEKGGLATDAFMLNYGMKLSKPLFNILVLGMN